MREEIRKAQAGILRAFAANSRNFALAGGTALELFYFKHRFSNDLDFFSGRYDKRDIEALVKNFKKSTGFEISFNQEFRTENNAKVAFYIAEIKHDIFLKIDFIEDVFFDKPAIKRFKGVPVYAAEHIYYQKIMAVAGVRLITDTTGKEKQTGRNAAKDVYDLFCLSEKIMPLHRFLMTMPAVQQRGMVAWHRSFSRQDFKLDVMDLDIYDRNVDSRAVIKHMDDEIKIFIKGVIA